MTLPQFGYCLPIFANPSAGLFRTPNLDRLDGPNTLTSGSTLKPSASTPSGWPIT